MMNLVGLRVVRGPDWKWDDQDGGQGCAGTVVDGGPLKGEDIAKELGQGVGGLFGDVEIRSLLLSRTRRAQSMRRAGIVDVVWDSGVQANYRAGHNGAYDLRVLDNALVGVKHPGVVCEGNKCEVGEILGIRWQCCECCADLCTTCFLDIGKRHDPQHKNYKRYDHPEAPPYYVRIGSNKGKVELKGLFVGAKVRKGRDWVYGNQDAGQLGEIVSMKYSNLGKVAVKWGSNAGISSYRCGLDGKVELKAVKNSVGGSYQPEWLPVLKTKESIGEPWPNRFAVSDRVKMVGTVGDLMENQEMHGGWNPDMEQFIGLVGVVESLDEDGDVEVKYEDYDQKWCLSPESLQKMSNYYDGPRGNALYCTMCNNQGTVEYRFTPCGHTTVTTCLDCSSWILRCFDCNAAQTDNMKKLGEMAKLLAAEGGQTNSSEIFVNIGNKFVNIPGSAEATPVVDRESPYRWKIVPGNNRVDLLLDGLGGTYLRRPGSSCTWQCSKKSGNSRNNCPVVVRELRGTFKLEKGPHSHC